RLFVLLPLLLARLQFAILRRVRFLLLWFLLLWFLLLGLLLLRLLVVGLLVVGLLVVSWLWQIEEALPFAALVLGHGCAGRILELAIFLGRVNDIIQEVAEVHLVELLLILDDDAEHGGIDHLGLEHWVVVAVHHLEGVLDLGIRRDSVVLVFGLIEE